MAKNKIKTHKATAKRYKLTHPKDKTEAKLMHRHQYRGCMHLQSKKSSSRKMRLRAKSSVANATQRRKIMKLIG